MEKQNLFVKLPNDYFSVQFIYHVSVIKDTTESVS